MPEAPTPDLSVTFAGISSPNPFWLASAPPTNCGEQVMRAFEAGWGGAVWKTIGEPIINVSSRYSSIDWNGQLVFGHAVCVQSARQSPALDYCYREPALRQLGRASQRSRSGANARDLLAPLFDRLPGKTSLTVEKMLHGAPLEPADGDRLLVVTLQHAGSFAQHINRTYSRTTAAQNVRVQDGKGCPRQVIASDLLNKPGDVDVRGTHGRARRIKAIQAAIGLGESFMRFEGWVPVGKTARHLRIVPEPVSGRRRDGNHECTPR